MTFIKTVKGVPVKPKTTPDVDMNTAGKSSKYLKEVIIPAYRKQKTLYEDRIKNFKKIIDEKTEIIKRQDKRNKLQQQKLEVAIAIAKDAEAPIPAKFQQTKNRKPKPRAVQIKTKIVYKENEKTIISANKTREFAKAYYEDKVWTMRLKVTPILSLLTFPIVEKYFEDTKIRPKEARILILISQYKWFVPQDSEDWGISPVLTRRGLIYLEAEGYVQVFEERRRKLYKTSNKGRDWMNGYMEYYDKHVTVLKEQQPSHEYDLPFITIRNNPLVTEKDG